MAKEKKREEEEAGAKTQEAGERKVRNREEEATSDTVGRDLARGEERARSKEFAGLSPGQEAAPSVQGANIFILDKEQGARARRGALAKTEEKGGALAKREGAGEDPAQGVGATTTARRPGAGGAGARRRSRQMRSADTGFRTPAPLGQSAEDSMTHPEEESGEKKIQGAVRIREVIRSQGATKSQGAIRREEEAVRTRIFSRPSRAK